MVKELLVICGPTATGKTSLGLDLASKFSGEIVSVDSRQVFKELTIGTGKDIPDGSIWKNGFWLTKEGIRIWGYDIVDATKEIHVASYTEYAKRVIKDIHERKKLPILVGGTGLYISALVEGIDTLKIPQDKSLRVSLESKSAEELFEILAPLNPLKAASLNSSDKKNPRRLIRAIEVSKMTPFHKPKAKPYDSLSLGLTAPIEILKERVKQRIEERLKVGLLDEIQDLLNQGVNWNCQSMTSLGYKEWKGYFEGVKSKEDCIKEWTNNENKYLKRQITWFKRKSNINWFDITKPNWREDVEELIKKWYK